LDEYEFVIGFHGAVLPRAFVFEGTPLPSHLGSVGMELWRPELCRAVLLARDTPVPTRRPSLHREPRKVPIFSLKCQKPPRLGTWAAST